MGKLLILDLDGTLINTADVAFKPMKDGQVPTELDLIPVFPGAIAFIQQQEALGNHCVIVSDSHPKYVTPIAEKIFGRSIAQNKNQALHLADKPNAEKTRAFLEAYSAATGAPSLGIRGDLDHIFLIGDTWLDIELGRKLNARTILATFYKPTGHDARDGIDDEWNKTKAGATYYAKSFQQITEILENPNQHLLCLEAIFRGIESSQTTRFPYQNQGSGFTAIRSLGRQNNGECDAFGIADKYFQIGNAARTPEFLATLCKGISHYLVHVAQFQQHKWDFCTAVPDKKSTVPPEKMKQILDGITTSIPKEQLFRWSDGVEGSLRNLPKFKDRRSFLQTYLSVDPAFDLNGKSIIIIDDQITTCATAMEISTQLRNRGAKNILFIGLVNLITSVSSKTCPKCGKPMVIKVRKADGIKFFSCPLPAYKGNGCGHSENIP